MTGTPFPRLLVANRGEIAVRIIRAARALGMETVAVFSEADAESPHVSLADVAICIGPAPADQSYLAIDRILDAARRTHATMIHPGYGFLSENPAFRAACEEAGLDFVGPPLEAMAQMASKAEARRTAQSAGIAIVPGYDGAEQCDQRLAAEAERIGFPVMVKATEGGGGRGLRRVVQASDLADALQSARAEAASVFGSADLILEKAIDGGRHVEVQILADNHGNVLHLFERDCSIQRRHQKVIEEAPSSAIDEDLRRTLGEQAVRLAAACNYNGAGTVEFLIGADGTAYFLEMNTRLQVEHPVTEAVTGIDLVQWQLRIAMGEALSFRQDDLELRGHAVEARVFAEDPENGFAPQTGTVLRCLPAARDGLRYDMGVETGSKVTAHYDPMLGKVIAWGEDRRIAIRRLHAALGETELLGLRTNRALLRDVLRSESFIQGNHDLSTLENILSGRSDDTSLHVLGAVAAALLDCRTRRPADRPDISPAPVCYHLSDRGRDLRVTLAATGRGYQADTAEGNLTLELGAAGSGGVAVTLNDVRSRVAFAFDEEGGIAVQLGGHSAHFENLTYMRHVATGGTDDNRLMAAMEGVIVAVLCAEGETVETGQALIVMESMKMEYRVRANRRAVVESLAVAPGDKVFRNQRLGRLRSAEC